MRTVRPALFTIVSLLAAFSCVTYMQPLLRTEPAERPEWVNTVPEYENAVCFVGVSSRRGAIRDARDDAFVHALRQVARYCGVYISEKAIEISVWRGKSSDTVDPDVMKQCEFIAFIQTEVSGVGAEGYFTEVYAQNGREAYLVYTLCRVNNTRLEQAIAELKLKPVNPPTQLPPQPGDSPPVNRNEAAVRVDFMGDAVSTLKDGDKESARHRVRQGIARGLQDAKAPVHLVSPDTDKQPGSVFVVTLNFQTFPKTRYSDVLYGCTYDIRLERDGNTIEPSELYEEEKRAFSPPWFLGEPLSRWLDRTYTFFKKVKIYF